MRGRQQLDGVAPIQLAEAEAADASVRIMAPANANELAGVDPNLVSRQRASAGAAARARGRGSAGR